MAKPTQRHTRDQASFYRFRLLSVRKQLSGKCEMSADEKARAIAVIDQVREYLNHFDTEVSRIDTNAKAGASKGGKKRHVEKNGIDIWRGVATELFHEVYRRGEVQKVTIANVHEKMARRMCERTHERWARRTDQERLELVKLQWVPSKGALASFFREEGLFKI